MDIRKMKESCTSNMFATRDTIKEALQYGYMVSEALEPTDRIAVITALHVLLNTVVAEVDKSILKEM